MQEEDSGMRYFLECTHTHGSQLRTGIQRVVRNIVNHAMARGDVTPVIIMGERLIAIDAPLLPPRQTPDRHPFSMRLAQAARALVAALRKLLTILLPFPVARRFINAPRNEFGLASLVVSLIDALRPASRPDPLPPGVEPEPGDVLVLIDASWHGDPWPAVRAFKAQGGKVVCMIHDLIPQTHPEFCDDRLRSLFNNWVRDAFALSDAFVCNSKTTAAELRKRLQLSGALQSISYFWLGSELSAETALGPARTIQALETDDPVYAYVGTIEPRKNQAYALDAFDHVWSQGVRARLLIVGRKGWMSEDFVSRVKNHPRYEDQLFLLSDLDDAGLEQIYERANGIVFTSIVEGFGLPLVEALQKGAPVFASEIPVFREIAAEGVTFVPLHDPRQCARAIIAHCAQGAPRLPSSTHWLTWAESTQAFFAAVSESLQASSNSRVDHG